ncbi:MAG: hypothetical protein AB8G17_05620 [Gammaproteobacteria bacterium]
MNADALRRLLVVREHRVDAARATLEGKQRIAEGCANEEQRLQKSLESLLLQRMHQQRVLGEQMQPHSGAGLQLLNVQQGDQFIGRLTDLASNVGNEIVAVRKALAKALEDVASARRVLRHAMAKRDALIKVRDEHEGEVRRENARREDEESEEIAARRMVLM